jgi:hypothetical protein
MDRLSLCPQCGSATAVSARGGDVEAERLPAG